MSVLVHFAQGVFFCGLTHGDISKSRNRLHYRTFQVFAVCGYTQTQRPVFKMVREKWLAGDSLLSEYPINVVNYDELCTILGH